MIDLCVCLREREKEKEKEKKMVELSEWVHSESCEFRKYFFKNLRNISKESFFGFQIE
jgi:hypothetical protein